MKSNYGKKLMSVNLYIHVFIKHSILSNPLLAILTKFQTKTTGVMTYKCIYELTHGFMRSSVKSTFFSHWVFKKNFKIHVGTEVKKNLIL